MRILRLAVESQRWDLAAHTIVLATAKIMHKGEQERAKKQVPTRAAQTLVSRAYIPRFWMKRRS
ncbi:hypothetical protein ACFLWZ_05475 [Chloroflexota bacterium]